MQEKIVELKWRLCMLLILADEEVSEKEVVKAARLFMNQFGEGYYSLITKLIEESTDSSEKIVQLSEELAKLSNKEELLEFYFCLVSIAYIDGIVESERKTLMEIGHIFQISENTLNLILDIFDGDIFSFQKRKDVLTIGAPESGADLPFQNYQGSVVFEEIDNSIRCIILKRRDLLINGNPVDSDYSVKNLEENDYFSFCGGLYNLKSKDLFSLFGEKANQQTKNYWIVQQDDGLAFKKEKPLDFIASVSHKAFSIQIELFKGNLKCGRRQLEMGRAYHFLDSEPIFQHKEEEAIFLVKRPFFSQSEKKDLLREIDLSAFDKEKFSGIKLQVQSLGNTFLVDAPACQGDLIYKGRKQFFPLSISDGDSLILSSLFLHFNSSLETPVQVSPLGISQITADNLWVKFKGQKKYALNGISFSLHAGDLAAIMGPAGAGKSTLLNALLGTLPLARGQVLANGHVLKKRLLEIKSFLGFVPQDDLLIEVFTVKENLAYTYRLKYPESKLSSQELDRLIDKTLKDVDLLHRKEAKVGNPEQRTLSGGERKRLNIALELITNPDILILDEPTSGLSSQDAEEIIFLLRQISNQGKIVLMVIHQPSSVIYKMINKTIILNRGGLPAFAGDNLQALALFKEASDTDGHHESVECPVCHSVDPDLLMKSLKNEADRFWQIAKRISDKFSVKLLQSEDRDETARKELPPPFVPGFSSRFKECFIQLRRLFVRKSRDKLNLLITFIISPALGALLAFLHRYNESGNYTFAENPHYLQFLYLSVITALFFGLSGSIGEIIQDKLILKREKTTHISRGIYFFSKFSVIGLFALFQCALFLIPAHLVLGELNMVLIHIPLMLLITMSAVSLGLLLSAFLKSPHSAHNLVPYILLPQIVLGGLFLDYDQMNLSLFPEKTVVEEHQTEEGLEKESVGSKEVPLLAQLIYARWGFELLATVNLYYDQNKKNERYYQEQLNAAKARHGSMLRIPKNLLQELHQIKTAEVPKLNKSLRKINVLPRNYFLSPELSLWFFQETWQLDLAVLLIITFLMYLAGYIKIKKL